MRHLISFSEFDEDEEDGEVVDGNIMPFDTSTSEALETWEGHSDVTVALAVVPGSQFTCFTGTKVQILTPVAADIYGHYIVPSLLALLVPKYT